jgi:CO dehydrogenase nickel-insertion accessory protein CooC1
LTSCLIEQQLKLVDKLAFQQVSAVPNRAKETGVEVQSGFLQSVKKVEAMIPGDAKIVPTL